MGQRWVQGLKIAIKSLRLLKLRAILPMLGVAIGVCAVMTVVAVGRGSQERIMRQIGSMGGDLIIVTAGQVRIVAGRPRQVGNVTTLTLKDAEAIGEECPHVRRVAPVQSRKLIVKYGPQSTFTTVVGTTPSYWEIRGLALDQGRCFTEEEMRGLARVAIIGETVVRNLFGDQPPLGEIIRIRGVGFEVIGVLQARGTNIMGQDEDDQILIPVSTALRRVLNLTYLNNIYVQAQDRNSIERAEREVLLLLRERHRMDISSKPDDFTIQNQAKVIEVERSSARNLTFLMAGIAAISLAIGGTGMVAVMLLSLKQRAGEIGLRRAVGARRLDILLQFLFESLLLGVGGGVAGLAGGTLICMLSAKRMAWPISLPLWLPAMALLFSILLGLLAGVYPALRAARLDPIRALERG
jgi:putative ABC transport system permease protein